MQYTDSDGSPLVEKIRDSAGQKGTGKWTAISSLEYGVPVTLIGNSTCLTTFLYNNLKKIIDYKFKKNYFLHLIVRKHFEIDAIVKLNRRKKTFHWKNNEVFSNKYIILPLL